MLSKNLNLLNSRDPTIEKLLLQNEMLNYRLEKAHQKYQQTIENIAAENSKLRNEVKSPNSSFFAPGVENFV